MAQSSRAHNHADVVERQQHGLAPSSRTVAAQMKPPVAGSRPAARVRFSRRKALIAALCVAASSMGVRAHAGHSEADVKAALIGKIANFIRWPKSAGLDKSKRPFVISVLGAPPIGSPQASARAPESIGARRDCSRNRPSRTGSRQRPGRQQPPSRSRRIRRASAAARPTRRA